ncbi:probable GABA transporter 2 isoform X2 [Dioscorea cayenensis subsp. rotundata]|uniref:Probable GABA transporter 2 isoform X2 n=1 Tax=Dioscorea cayennensis subsp. rotundata TaxID=55577 RepID=A0AB40ALP6_DIOCR|nr:probable GABA transporter 2 isoform X2 [Dioscorea cayenensis subsp. rotundata]
MDLHHHPSSSSSSPSKPLPTLDAGAALVLKSKGTWWHAGCHLTTAIVGPTILTLPYALRGLGWGLGLVLLSVMASVTFYAYLLMSRVLEHCERGGRRHIRFRELAADVLGSGWMLYFVVCIQGAINTGIGIGTILLAADCLQLPSFHSLRHINLASLLMIIGYAVVVVAGCLNAGFSKNPPPRKYSLDSSKSNRSFNAFTSISILASIFGNGILPEIQATVAPPVAGKMLKALLLCYSVIFVTFYPVAISGYWVFGNEVNSNVLQSLMPDSGPSLAPTWLLGLAVVFILLQLVAIGLVYSQVAYEIMEKNSADVNQGTFSKRNLIPRIILRTLYMIFCGFVAAMLPFFGDVIGVVGAIGFIPLDFILPMLLYNMAIKPPTRSVMFMLNMFIMVVFTGVGIMGAFSSIRKLVLDANEFSLFSDNVVN